MLKSSRIQYIALFLAFATASCAQTYTVLRNFGRVAGDPENTATPGTITQSRGGAMFSTSIDSNGNADQMGKAFRISTTGSLTVLYQFDKPSPTGGLILGTDGQFYGITQTGGAFGFGSVFKMTQHGIITTLHDFTGGADGEFPNAAPIESIYGDLYGTTGGDGNTNWGTIYKMTRGGNFTLLHTFTPSDGGGAVGPLVQGTDFNFYGTTQGGGSHNCGTIFRVSRDGDFIVLVNFDRAMGLRNFGGLIQANDGNFYGTTQYGGSNDVGVLFRMKPNGTFSVLHNFTAGNDDGGGPIAGLIQASDGNLYGTNVWGGGNGWGIIYRATLAGHIVSLHDNDWATGAGAENALLQHTNGLLYGDMAGGGKFDKGVFYRLDVALPPFVTYLPVYGRAGAEVQILGQGFTSASMVAFNGTPAASPVVVYPTYLKVIVPSGATTGPITVTTANGTLTSNKVFIVH